MPVNRTLILQTDDSLRGLILVFQEEADHHLVGLEPGLEADEVFLSALNWFGQLDLQVLPDRAAVRSETRTIVVFDQFPGRATFKVFKRWGRPTDILFR